MNTYNLPDPQMLTLKGQLLAARARISSSGNWTQRAAFRNRDGKILSYPGPEVFSYSATGALYAEGLECHHSNEVIHSLCGIRCSLYDYNDSHTHAEILDLFDRAIDACLKR